MSHTYRIHLFTFLILQMAVLGYSQNNGNKGSKGTAPKSSLIGKVLYASNELPLEFATITLMNAADSSVVTGGITDEAGSFDIEIKPGNYLIKIEFISYKSQFRNDRPHQPIDT